MERVRDGRRTGWILVVGLMAGALLFPRVAEAVGSIVTIQGAGSTTKAGVTKANQLESAEAPPSAFRVFRHSEAADPNCHPFFNAVPADTGFIVRTAVVSVTEPSSSGLTLTAVFPNGTCSGQPLASAPTQVASDYSIPIEPGFAVAPGRRFSMEVAAPGAVVDVYLYGYLVPAADVPATTPVKL
ncbi:MAG: hypothetical protein ACJ77A_09160 [Actinomycetota bacterium]